MGGKVLTVIEAMIMPDGWHFLQLMPTGIYLRIDGATYPDLLDMVLNFRLQNSIDVGDVEGDVINYICTKYPHQCHKSPAPPSEAVASAPVRAGQRFIDAIIEWAIRVKGNPLTQRLETEHEAHRRAGVCINCPLNQEWENNCPKCVDKAQQYLTMIRRNKDLPGLGKRLHGCRAQNHCNRTAVWLTKQIFVPVEGLPGHCWLK